MIDNEIEEAVKEKKREQVIEKLNDKDPKIISFPKSSSSGSEGEEDSGIFTKIKEKAADVFDWCSLE